MTIARHPPRPLPAIEAGGQSGADEWTIFSNGRS